MLAFYDAFADFVRVGRVLDGGSGSGSGTSRLLQRGLQVVAVDEDLTAVEFARRHCPDADHVHKSLAALELGGVLDGAIVTDVLGSCEDPEAQLSAIHRALRLGSPVLVAEPAAHVSQRLSFPQRRGFSVARLRSLLVRTGFEVEAVIADRVPFVALLARAAFPEVRAAFADAYAAANQGDVARALNELQRARGTGRYHVEVEILLAEAELSLARGDGDHAANAFFRTRELDGSDARPLVGLGRIALASGNNGDALELALDALRLDPTEPAAYVLVALASSALGHADSFAAWRAAGRLAPDDAFVVGELTKSALTRGDHPIALAGLEQLERYGVTLEAAHHVTRAWLLLALGRRGEASIEARIARAKEATHPELNELERALSDR